MCTTVTVTRSVVLVKGPRADDAEIAPGHEDTALVVHLELRFDGHLAQHVEGTQKGLPRRLGTWVDKGQGLSQGGRTSSPRPGCLGELVGGAEPEPHRGVQHHQQVEQPEVTSTGEDGLRHRSETKALDLPR